MSEDTIFSQTATIEELIPELHLIEFKGFLAPYTSLFKAEKNGENLSLVAIDTSELSEEIVSLNIGRELFLLHRITSEKLPYPLETRPFPKQKLILLLYPERKERTSLREKSPPLRDRALFLIEFIELLKECHSTGIFGWIFPHQFFWREEGGKFEWFWFRPPLKFLELIKIDRYSEGFKEFVRHLPPEIAEQSSPPNRETDLYQFGLLMASLLLERELSSFTISQLERGAGEELLLQLSEEISDDLPQEVETLLRDLLAPREIRPYVDYKKIQKVIQRNYLSDYQFDSDEMEEVEDAPMGAPPTDEEGEPSEPIEKGAAPKPIKVAFGKRSSAGPKRAAVKKKSASKLTATSEKAPPSEPFGGEPAPPGSSGEITSGKSPSPPAAPLPLSPAPDSEPSKGEVLPFGPITSYGPIHPGEGREETLPPTGGGKPGEGSAPLPAPVDNLEEELPDELELDSLTGALPLEEGGTGEDWDGRDETLSSSADVLSDLEAWADLDGEEEKTIIAPAAPRPPAAENAEMLAILPAPLVAEEQLPEELNLDESTGELLDEERAGTSTKGEEQKLEKVLRRKGVVRCYTQMNPGKIFPLLVSILEVESYIKRVELSGVEQVESERVMKIKEKNPFVRIVPILPGCLVSPSEMVVDVRQKKVDAQFWVAPQSEGDLRRSARVQLWQGERLLDEIPLPCKITTQFWTKVAAFSSALSIVGGAFLDAYGGELLKADPGQFSGNWGAWLLRQFVELLSKSGFWLGLFFMGVAFLSYLWLKPREGDPVEKFLTTELH